VQPEEI